jgi:hypothetical protein
VTPPDATLVAGRDRHAGEAGSWFWSGMSNDAPWLPAIALEHATIPSGPVAVELEGGAEAESWSAQAATAADFQGAELTDLGNGTGGPAFDTPGPGDWVLAVSVRFAGGVGSATYYWSVTVT